MFLLDTNIISYWMRGDLPLIEKIKTYSPQDLSISTITLAEIYYGIEKSSVKKKERRTKIGLIKSQLEIFSFNELTISLLLSPPGYSSFPAQVFSLVHYGSEGMVAAICLVQIAILILPIYYLGRCSAQLLTNNANDT